MTWRIPILPALLVAIAVATMIGLGVWQLNRAGEKEILVEQYRASAQLPPVAFPTAPAAGEPPLFRRATGYCLKPVSRRATAGANRRGEAGYVHIVHCSTGAEGPGMAVEIGWSKDPNAKWQWEGGPVTGIIAPDRMHRMRLVAEAAPPGLEPSARPSIASAIRVTPTGHRLYAATWFALAVVAVIIFVLAIRKRQRAR